MDSLAGLLSTGISTARTWTRARGCRQAVQQARAADSLIAFGSSLAADALPVGRRERVVKRILAMGAIILGLSGLIASGVLLGAGRMIDVVWAFRKMRSSGCRPAQWKTLRRARALEVANVALDVDRALRQGDHRLVAIRGEAGCSVPGFKAFAACDASIRVIGDAPFDVVDSEQRRFEAAAIGCAQRYNQLLQSRLDQR